MLKITIFSDPPAFDAPVGTLPYRLVWETGIVGLRDCEKKFEDMFSRFDTIPAPGRQTDGRTDGQASCANTVRAMQSIHEFISQIECSISY